MKSLIRKTLLNLGLDVRRARPSMPKAGSASRPIGNIGAFLEDVRARGFIPKGIIDVGANHGNWTKMALKVFPDATIIMIEPQREMESELRAMCAQNSKLGLVLAGAGKEKGELAQTIYADLAGSTFVPEANEDQLRTGTQRITPIVTIDSVVEARKPFTPDLVKLDIQGFELEALKGATSLFGKTELFILETSLYRYAPRTPTTLECMNFMDERGYQLYDVTDHLRRPYDGALGQIDLAFAKKNGQLAGSNAW